MKHPYFFGYGSLVNRRTHDYAPAFRAVAEGWRRAWRYTDGREVAYLTAIREPGCRIEGHVAAVPGGDWQALDIREAAYERHIATSEIAHPGTDVASVSIYAINPEHLKMPDDHHPVVLSYIDVVVQGYLAEFGPEGVTRFFETTTGWEVPILNDRAAPRYPRTQALRPEETLLVDDALGALGCRIID